jgi:hypothetical protein
LPPEEDCVDIDAKAQITLGIDEDDNVFMIMDFNDGCDGDLSNLIFLLNSGTLMEDSMQTLLNSCEDPEQAEQIAKKTYEMLFAFAQQKQQAENIEDEPLVDPCEVFGHKQRMDNEFKG